VLLALELQPAVVQTVNQAGTATTLTSSANASVFGQAVTLTASVAATPGSTTPDGTVTFFDGATSIGSGTLNGGQATFTSSSLAVGVHSITASYAGASNFVASASSATSQTVNKDATTTAITGSPNPIATGQSVTFTIAVSANAPGSGSATGTVTLRLPKATLGTISLDSTGRAAFTISNLPTGADTITAVYNGDSNFTTSSGIVVQTVGAKAASKTTLTTSQNPAVFGAPVTFMALVTGVGSAPTGTVSFVDSKITLATVALNAADVATFTTSNLSIGTHNIRAQYNGSSQYNSSGSNVVSQTVTAASSSTAVARQSALLNPTLMITSPAPVATSQRSQEPAGAEAAGQTAAAIDRIVAFGLFAGSTANALSLLNSLPAMDLSALDQVFSEF
jgi:hypothetical protein